MERRDTAELEFRSTSGVVLALVRIVPVKDTATAPLIHLEEAEAREFGEAQWQLRENDPTRP